MKLSTLVAGLSATLAATSATSATSATTDWKPTAQVEYEVPALPSGAVDTSTRVIKLVNQYVYQQLSAMNVHMDKIGFEK